MRSLVPILLVVFTIGCMAKAILVPTPSVVVSVAGDFTQEQQQTIQADAERAFNQLMNCKYFAKYHPFNRRYLATNHEPDRSGPKHIFINSTNNVEAWKEFQQVICGSAMTSGKHMKLNVDMFNDSGCQMQETIAHEMLHMAGMEHESHRGGGPLYEEFDKTLKQCGLGRK